MILFPAIDLKDGQCVRLVKGNMKKTTIFNNSPTEQARLFQNSGCSWLHLVDLDGAVKGQNINSKSVKEIINSTDLKIQLGGGIRKKEQVETWDKKTRVMPGKKYIKIVQDTGVFCFIAKEDFKHFKLSLIHI